MSFRNRKALTTAAAIMLITACFMFVIPESSDVAAASVETVVIESDMDDGVPLSDIILQYSAISAEKEHQESMGNNVIINDRSPQRDDFKEQKFIDDMRHMIGLKDRTTDRMEMNEPQKQTMDKDPVPLSKAEQPQQPTPASYQIQPIDIIPVAEPADTETDLAPEETTETTVSESDEISNETMTDRTIAADELTVLDKDFIASAIELAQKDGVELGSIFEYYSDFNNKIDIMISYSEVESADISPKDDETADDDAIIVEEENDDEESLPIPDGPAPIHDLFSIPVAGESVTDTLCSGTDI